MVAVVPNLRLFLNSGFLALRLAEKANSRITVSPVLEIDLKPIIKLLTLNGGRQWQSQHM